MSRLSAKTCVVFLSIMAGSASAHVAAGKAPAPVTLLTVVAVDSQDGGFESTEGFASASRHHGGGYMKFLTVERGAGQAWAKMNGADLKLVKMENVCFYGNEWGACANGQIVEGYLRTWDATGKGNGTFQVWVRSHNAPYNTMTRTFSLP